MAVSKYAANREVAIKALLELTDERNDVERMLMTGGIPTHAAVMERADVKSRSPLLAMSAELMNSVVARPSLALGGKYTAASLAYAGAVNKVLRREVGAEAAMVELEKELMKITGLPGRD